MQRCVQTKEISKDYIRRVEDVIKKGRMKIGIVCWNACLETYYVTYSCLLSLCMRVYVYVDRRAYTTRVGIRVCLLSNRCRH